MRKLSVLFVFVLLIFSLEGCGGGSSKTNSTETNPKGTAALDLGDITGKEATLKAGATDMYSISAEKDKSYVVELFDVASNLASETGPACSSGTYYSGLALELEDSSNSRVTVSCSPVGVGNVHNALAFKASETGDYYIKVFSNLAASTEAGKYKIRILPKYDQPEAKWDDKQEPNNHAMNAFALKIGSENPQESDIEQRNNGTTLADIDWFRFEATQGVSYVIELFDVASNLASEEGPACSSGSYYSGLALALEDANNSTITVSCSPAGVGNVHNALEFKATETGVHYIKVFSNLAASAEAGSYKIRVLPKHDQPEAKWDDKQEPNNHAINAFALKVGSENPLESDIEQRNNGTTLADIDWFRFEVIQGVSYVVELFDVASNLASEKGPACSSGTYYSGLALELEDSRNARITGSCRPVGTGNVHNALEFKALETGVYYIKVFSNLAASAEAGKYKIRVLPKHDQPEAKWDDKQEPNNFAINAFALTLGVSISSDIEQRNSGTTLADIDWFRFEATQGASYVVELSDVSSNLASETGPACSSGTYYSGLALALEDANNTSVTSVCSSVGTGNVHNTLRFSAAADGTYYIKVFPNLAASMESGVYSISVKTE